MSTTLAHGRLEVRTFAIGGVPVRGAFEVVREAVRGEHTLAVRRPLRPPELAPGDARIDAETAAAAAVRAGPAALGDAPPETPPVLVYRLILGTPVLAWEIQLPLTIRPEPTRKTVWISASSGTVLDERENVLSSRARVFAGNPSSTPDAIEISLTDIDATAAGVPLDGPRVRSLNCTMAEPAEPEPWHQEGDCWAVARTFSDEAGDYFVPLPDPIDPESGVDGDDLYAELSMYVHAERFMNGMAERGVTEYRCPTSTMIANVRTIPEPGDDVDYVPLNNAYYTDQCDSERGATMLFGQGSDVDFAFDADVIYHELGHGLVAQLTPAGLSASRPRSDALVVDAVAVNEAMADYVSVIFQGDPDLAEYVGRFWTSQSSPYIRTANNTKRCPDDTIGQVHNDGEPLMAAMWATRVHVGERLDAIVLQSLARLADDTTLEEAAAALLEVAAEAVGAGAITEAERGLFERELVVRGLTDCPRVITDPAAVAAGRTMHLRRVTAAVSPFWPGPMQLRYEVPADGRALVVEFDLLARGSDEAPTAAVLVKRAATPIAFTYDLVARDTSGDPVASDASVRELTLVEGDWDLRVDAERVTDTLHRAEIGGLRPGEIVHLGVVATNGVDAVATGVRVLDDRDHGEVGGSSDDGGGSSGGDAREDVYGDGAVASCGCTPAQRPAGTLGWLGLVALLLRRRGIRS